MATDPVPKVRLDMLMVARGLVESRDWAQRLIRAGEVRVNGQVVDQPARRVEETAEVTIEKPPRYVSRGGFKLEAALDHFCVNPAGWVCADVGSSTGGFTDCLLQRGAARVYAIDVGANQLHWRLRQDARVVLMEKVNARYLEALPEPVDLAVVDVSFISLTLILPKVFGWVRQGAGQVIALIKPQFEAGREYVSKGGIVRDPAVHQRVVKAITTFAAERGWRAQGVIPSPITGSEGNVEFLTLLRPVGN
ncbi:MAG: TlyA family RNA methyltransferase [Anaerolineae bacterium]|nr:TlyA family RNA methyltransferase [Thermoflexales bacterium]MDW8396162.1 TlyA family RNA methyltransferase [Anaerolineae bacterium]